MLHRLRKYRKYPCFFGGLRAVARSRIGRSAEYGTGGAKTFAPPAEFCRRLCNAETGERPLPAGLFRFECGRRPLSAVETVAVGVYLFDLRCDLFSCDLLVLRFSLVVESDLRHFLAELRR